jgi:hypothetical protein
MPKQNTRRPLPASILSLLVAADQCCPAIIGQAHLLYHTGPGINPEQTVRTFTQLRKDADDLFKAIADVEAALNQDETIQRGAAEHGRAGRTTEHNRLRLLPAKSSGPCSRGQT